MSRKPGAKMVAQLSQTIKREAEAEQSPTVPPPTVPPPTVPPPTVPPPTVPPPEKKIKIVFDLTGGKIPQPTTPEEILSKALQSSSQQDKNYEFLKFKKNCPKLLPLVHAELVQKVRKELQVQNVDIDEEQLSPAGCEPLLPAVGNKLGQSVERILAPPVTNCLLCSKQLSKHNSPLQVSLLTNDGPTLASKFSWRCRDCLDSRGVVGIFSHFFLLL